MFILLKVLRKKGFVLDESVSNNNHNLSFIYNDYKVNLLLSRYRTGISFTISYNDVKAKHYLYLNTERVLKDETIDYKNVNRFNTIDILTVWNLYSFDDLSKPILNSPLKEEEKVVVSCQLLVVSIITINKFYHFSLS